jgi:N-acetyl-gamma-glutamylphosphate reductase
MKVFIDGQFGTTGLKLESRLKERADITLLQVDFEVREEFAAKKPRSGRCVFVFAR